MNKDTNLLAEAYQSIYKEKEYLLEFDMASFTHGIAHAIAATSHVVNATSNAIADPSTIIQQINSVIGDSVKSAIHSVGTILAWTAAAGIGAATATNLIAYYLTKTCENAKKQVARNVQMKDSTESAAKLAKLSTPEMLELKETNPQEYAKRSLDYALELDEMFVQEFKKRKLPLDLPFLKRHLDSLATGIKSQTQLVAWIAALLELLHKLHTL